MRLSESLIEELNVPEMEEDPMLQEIILAIGNVPLGDEINAEVILDNKELIAEDYANTIQGLVIDNDEQAAEALYDILGDDDWAVEDGLNDYYDMVKEDAYNKAIGYIEANFEMIAKKAQEFFNN